MGKVLSDAAMAHHKAMGSMDSKLVTTAADYQAVNAGIGKMIASVPSSQVMDVFNAFSQVVPPTVPNNMFSMSAPSEATAAYDAFLQFKDVVKAASGERCRLLCAFTYGLLRSMCRCRL